MSRLPDNLKERVRETTDIVDLVSETVTLQKAGQRFRGLCPFHEEKTPSFHVNPELGLYHCFGCQKGGDCFTWIQEMQGVDFLDALRFLAERAGIEIEGRGDSGATETIYRIYAHAAAFYGKVLSSRPEGKAARDYLASRGYGPEEAKAFGLGAAPDAWDGLLVDVRQAGFPDEAVRSSGLFVDRKSGQGYYDRFRNRLIFPIRAATGRVVAFGGRVLGDDTPKYINSSDSPIYRKGDHLYGLDTARAEIRTKGRVIVAEGYTDCLALHRADVRNCVAALGTAFTPNQAKLLSRYTQEVILLFDADSAGRAATLRGMETLMANGLSVRVAALPAGEDPDSVVRAGGSIDGVIEGARDGVLFALDAALEGADSPATRVQKVAPVLELLSNVRDVATQDGYLELVADRLRTQAHVLRRQMPGSSARKSPLVEQDSGAECEGGVVTFQGAKELFRLVLLGNETTGKVFAEVAPEWIPSPALRVVFESIRSATETGVDVATAIGEVSAPEIRGLLQSYAVDPTPVGDPDELLADVVKILKKGFQGRLRASLYRDFDSEGDANRKLEILEKINRLAQGTDEIDLTST